MMWQSVHGLPDASVSNDPADLHTHSRVVRALAQLPLFFEPNKGQLDPTLLFVSRSTGGVIALTADGVSLHLHDNQEAPRAALRIRWIGGGNDQSVDGEELQQGVSHYFNARYGLTGLTDVPHYAQVRYRQLYPGIDVLYYGNPRALEYDLVLAPGADHRAIEFEIGGASGIRVDTSGDLLIDTSAGSVRKLRPQLYQPIAGRREPVEGHYVERGHHRYGIAVGDHDPKLPLVIDPVIAYGNHVGGNGRGSGIAVDANGNAYVTGYVFNGATPAFPLVNAYDASIGHNGSDIDAFVQKYNPSGTALVYSTYLGNSKSTDKGIAIAVDADGNAYVTGTTSGGDFPTTAGRYQGPVASGGAFVSKLSAAGNALLYSTYVLNATPTAIAVDATGSAYITGAARSGFATTAGSLQPINRSASATNGFVLKVNPAGTAATYATFIGGTGTDVVNGLALDGANNAYLVGSTTSADFPTLNAFRFNAAGGKDAFVSKLNASGNALVFSTFLGGTQDDYANAVAVDSTGSVYVTGTTASFDFPTRNAFQPTKAGRHTTSPIDNAFVTKLTPSGNDIVYSSFLGGESCIDASGVAQCLFYTRPVDTGTSIAVDAEGRAIVGGGTTSILFPRIDSLRGPVEQNGAAGFVAKVSVGGGALLYSTLLGGEPGDSYDYVLGLGLDASGNVYGVTNYTSFPTTNTMPATTGNVVFKLASPITALTLSTSANPAVGGQSIAATAAVTGGTSNASVTFLDGSRVLGSAAVQNGVATLAQALPVGIRALTAIYRDGSNEAESNRLLQVVNPRSSCP